MRTLFGAKVRYLRGKHQLTQEELAIRLHVISRAQLTNVEAGRRTPSFDLIVRAAAVFGVSTDYLLRDTIPVDTKQAMSTRPNDVDQTFRMEHFSQVLRQLRLQRNLTQAQLAQQLGLQTHAHISHLEAGRHEPSLELFLQIADFFGVTTDTLLYE